MREAAFKKKFLVTSFNIEVSALEIRGRTYKDNFERVFYVMLILSSPIGKRMSNSQ